MIIYHENGIGGYPGTLNSYWVVQQFIGETIAAQSAVTCGLPPAKGITSNLFDTAAYDIMVALERHGGAHVVTYTRKSDGQSITTHAVRDTTVDEFSNFESTVSEWRQAFDLLVDDIGVPCRGDTITDQDAVVWTVQDILEASSDEEIVRVTVT